MSDEEAVHILQLCTLAQLGKAAQDRGWVLVPKDYATRAFPKEVESGWWPTHE